MKSSKLAALRQHHGHLDLGRVIWTIWENTAVSRQINCTMSLTWGQRWRVGQPTTFLYHIMTFFFCTVFSVNSSLQARMLNSHQRSRYFFKFVNLQPQVFAAVLEILCLAFPKGDTRRKYNLTQTQRAGKGILFERVVSTPPWVNTARMERSEGNWQGKVTRYLFL